MSITAIVQNDTIKLPVHVPDGTQVEVVLPPAISGGDSFIAMTNEGLTAALTGDRHFEQAGFKTLLA